VKSRKEESREKGKINEFVLLKTLLHNYPYNAKKKKGMKFIRSATPSEDWNEHWDQLFVLGKNDKERRIDCKSQASVGSGYDKIYLENELWGEHRAVFKKNIYKNRKYVGVNPNYTNGTSEIREGSIYGKADLFAYRFPKHIILVLAKSIRKLLKDRVDLSSEILEYGTDPDASKYLYKNYGRYDHEYKEEYKKGLIDHKVQRGDRLFLYSLSDLELGKDYWKIDIPVNKLKDWKKEYEETA
jgi:hypothetical protein